MQETNRHTPSPFPPTPHFAVLDGLRGIAALAVVVYHFMEIVVPDYEKLFIAHAYLAVDFFFCLSGFVIACAYDARLGSMGVLGFLRRRLIRLHPLVLVGSVLGLLTFLFDPFINLYATYGSQTWQLFVASCLLIPYPVVSERTFNLFPLNAPTWSLFWEYLANVAYALLLMRLRPGGLRLLTLLAAAALVYQAYLVPNLSIGWGLDTFWGGGARVSYSFLMGMVLYRSRWIVPTRLGFVGVGALLVAGLLFPYYNELTRLTDLLTVLIYFPLLVALGAGAHLAPRLAGPCRWLGELSYPLYMVHYPFVWVFLSYDGTQKPSTTTLAWLVPGATLALVGLAYLILVLVDAPLRRYLSSHA
ncbi:acyltransferase [Hymenobacter sp. 5317J-9]|uniref:acyltransferase family protein n=1 Tax=Hymenobacter sp. 5317J-9 TaxID=2932250 RepID=UPI001FD71EF1|nr:acyltransferase [Hymenobacter sp. 5317J-9]UOQ96360.1 acyltransferase [Hymenobacter sp. 5317J-9]